MRIEFAESGGLAYLPGLNKPVTIDIDCLDAGEAEQLRRSIEAARFFELPAAIGATAPGAADYQHYTLTVEDGGRRHTVRMLVPLEDSALQDLIRIVRKYVKAARAAGRGTPPNPTAGKPR